MKKKVYSFSLILFFVIVLVACGSTTEFETTWTSSDTQTVDSSESSTDLLSTTIDLVESSEDTTSEANTNPTTNTTTESTTQTTTEVVTTEATTTEELVEEVDFNQNLKVLAIGNSFSVDGMEYLYKVADDYGVDNIVLGILYIGGASLEMHVNCIENNLNSYVYYKNSGDVWTYANSQSTVLDGLLDEDWDIITIQQVSGYSGIASTYNDDIDTIINYVNANKTNDSAKIVWHMTWAYQEDSTHPNFPLYSSDQMTMYSAITSTVQEKILSRDDLAYVIPSGTAIQNLRSSYMGDTLTRDGYHLSYDIGRYTAALTWFEKITGFDISGISYAPDGLTQTDILAIKEAVDNAVTDSFEISVSTYQQAETQIIIPLTDQVELVYNPGYYNPLSSYNVLFDDSSGSNALSSLNFISKDELPIGSVIKLADGYQYRVSYWTDTEGSLANNRLSDYITSSVVVIDEAWWGEQQYVTFTISKADHTDIIGQSNIIDQIFQIQSSYSDLSLNYTSGYYNSLGSNTLINYGTIYMNYITHDTILTRADLPIGSIIVIESGYQYRANFWLSETSELSENRRTDNIITHIVVVDEAWWGDDQLVAFNISQLGTPDISAKVATVASMFRVIVPLTELQMEEIIGVSLASNNLDVVLVKRYSI